MTACPDCAGRGRFEALIYSLGGSPQVMTVSCARCGGDGETTGAAAIWHELGDAHRRRRVERGESLGTCAARLGLALRDLVDMEHGRADPRRLADA